MRRFVSLSIVCLVAAMLVFPSVVKADLFGVEETTSKIAGQAGYAPATEYTLSEKIGQIIRIVLSLVGTIFLGLTIYAGILWMTASGNDERVTTATGILKTAVIGLVITLAAYGVTVFVMAKIGGASQESPSQVGATTPAQSCGGFWSCWWQGFNDQSNSSKW